MREKREIARFFLIVRIVRFNANLELKFRRIAF